MTSRASIQSLTASPARLLTWAAIGACGLALLTAAVSTGDDATVPKKSIPEQGAANPDEAPTGFDMKTNGFELQADYDADMKTFQEIDTIEKGLGPVYNDVSCVNCHRNPVPGGSSQINEIRAGRRKFDPVDPNPDKVIFEEPVGGSVFQQRAIDAAIQETVQPEDDVRTLRMSNTVLGNGYIELIPDAQILSIRDEQEKWGMAGYPVVRPVPISATLGTDGRTIEFTSVERLGRFGWKCQEASLLNFSAGAYVTEIGITSPSQMKESLSNGRDVSKYDTVPEPEDTIKDDDPTKPDHLFGNDVEAFTRFMRSTKASPRDEYLVGKPDTVAGEKLFRDNATLGCAICHRPDYTTPMPGDLIKTLDDKQGSDMKTVPEKLGNKTFHPYSDFMLHDVGTGDGIAQTQHADLPGKGQATLQKLPEKLRQDQKIGRVDGGTRKDDKRQLKPDPGVDQLTANKVRTAPLWGLRTRPQLLHDGSVMTIEDAIRRHAGQAEGVRLKYEALSSEQKKQLLAFLKSL